MESKRQNERTGATGGGGAPRREICGGGPDSISGVDPNGPDVSIVIPVKNEQDNVEPLSAEIREAMDASPYSWEVIYIDDGSQDRTLERLRAATRSGG
jgi:dolichol-phosphate mannosyltransferase